MLQLSRALRTECLDFSVVFQLVHTTISSLNDALLLAANWVLELREDNEQEIKIEITSTDISTQCMCTFHFSLKKNTDFLALT